MRQTLFLCLWTRSSSSYTAGLPESLPGSVSQVGSCTVPFLGQQYPVLIMLYRGPVSWTDPHHS